MQQFENQIKQQAFDRIAGKYYEHNFGQTSKADFDILMFGIYLENLQMSGGDTDDFAMACALGITEARVRSLKVRYALQYPGTGKDWKSIFIESVRYAVYDDKTDQVKLSVTDPNVKRNLEHRIDELHIYSEAQLNGKLLQMRPDHFVRLVMSLSDELGGEGIDREDLEGKLKASTVADSFLKQGILERLRAGADIESLLPDILKAAGKTGIKLLLSGAPFGGTLRDCVDTFIEKL